MKAFYLFANILLCLLSLALEFVFLEQVDLHYGLLAYSEGKTVSLHLDLSSAMLKTDQGNDHFVNYSIYPLLLLIILNLVRLISHFIKKARSS